MKLAMAMTSAREHYIREYWDSSFLLPVVDMPRRLVEARRKRGWWSNELSPHQNKVALETALGIVRASWRSAIGRTRKEIESDRSLSSEEVAYARWLLSDAEHLARCVMATLTRMHSIGNGLDYGAESADS